MNLLKSGLFTVVLIPLLAMGIGVVSADYIVDWGPPRENLPLDNDFIAISSGASHALGLRSDGSIIGWGYNNLGQCNVPIGTGYKAIDADWDWSVALDSEGSIIAWGINDYGQLNVPPGNGYQAVAAGSHQGVAIQSDGTLVAWGEPYMCNVPSGNDYIAVSSGDSLSIALKSNGSIVAWGWTGVENEVPSGNDFVALSAGGYHGLALKSDGSLIAWGYNGYGQCDYPAGNDYIAIAGGAYSSIALKSDGSIVAWGSDMSGTISQVPEGTGYTAISTSYYYNCALHPVIPPLAEANGPYSGSINQLITFSSAGSYDPDGSIVTYDWNWGDGTAHGTVDNPTHAYTTAGTKTVTLTVTDNLGATGSDTATVTIRTPCQDINDLKAIVKSMTLSPTIRTALNTRLNKASTLCAGGPAKYPAIATLFKNDFIPYVNTKTGKGITPAQAKILIDQANLIIAACGG